MVNRFSGFFSMLKIALAVVLGTGNAQLLAQMASAGNGAPKNVILIIGDGMGPQQIGLLEAYARHAPRSVIKDRTTAFSRLLAEGGVLGMSMTNAANALNTDSAASATQLAIGKPSGPEMIGIDIQGTLDPTILEIANKLGKSTGLVSDVRLTHATPAPFAAHQPHRTMENEIAVDMLAAGVNVMLSGGLRHWIPQQANDPATATYRQVRRITTGAVEIESRREDDRNLLEEARQRGYQLVFTKSQLEQAESNNILGLFAASALPDAITARHLRINGGTIPTLAEMSATAIAALAKNDRGFFLVIEAGLIDWAAHYNDTGTMLYEMLVINDVLNQVLDWAGGREDTVVVVTADHETGGFGFSYSSADLPKPVAFPGSAFPGAQYQPVNNYGNQDVLDKLHAQKLSYTGIFANFDTLKSEQQTPLKLMELVNQHTEFDISRSQAGRILTTAVNPYYVEGHDSLGYKIVPRMDVNAAFYSEPTDDNRQNLLAIEVANSQSVVWSNGNHTATPVMVFASGPKQTTARFIQLMDQPQLGQKLIKIVMDEG